MRGLRKYLVTAALTGSLAFAGALGAGSAVAAPAPADTAGVTAPRDQGHEAAPVRAPERGQVGVRAWSCAAWTEVMAPGLWGRSCHNPTPAQGAGEAYNGRSYDVRFRVTVKSRTPWGDLNLGSCDSWVAPGAYFFCGGFNLEPGLGSYPVVAYFQQLQP